jgi:predicted DNA-binding antitoxin AbrB/MazE fold protein
MSGAVALVTSCYNPLERQCSFALWRCLMDGQNVLAVYENGVFRPITMVLDLQEGQQVVLTVRHVEQLDAEEEKRRDAEMMREMEEAGELDHPAPPDEPPPKDWRPLVIEGKPLSETVIRMRGER